jgi:hypothetical protein
MTFGLDAPGSRCAFGSRCTLAMTGHGGFDEHHEHPLSLGGVEGQSTMLVLCPQHHRRQHSLIRYLVECDTDERNPLVLRHFTRPERAAAEVAYMGWVSVGRPHVTSWPCPAARA